MTKRFSPFKNLSSNPTCVIFDATLSVESSLRKSSWLKGFRLQFLTYIGDKTNITSKTYSTSDEVAQGCGEVTVLCGRSLRNLIARYPYRSRYVLIQIKPLSLIFYVGLIGFARRYLIGMNDANSRIGILGIRTAYKYKTSFIILKNPNATVTNHYSISSEIGYGGLLDFLNQTGKKYVVLRFFEKLPKGNREAGDLDILVEDSLEAETAAFLTKNPGTNMVDMYSVRGSSNAARIPYHTPYLSEKILNESEIYKSYRIPSKENYLYSFIYHCLYHKGLSSGIKTRYKELKVSQEPDNDYLGKIRELANQLGEDPGATLEELDDYMRYSQWRPHTDTLDLLASTNKWLARHLKSETRSKELTLTICVLKAGFQEKSKLEEFEKELAKQKMEILSREQLKGERCDLAANHLRGGNWSAINDKRFLPYYIFVLFDRSDEGHYCRQHEGRYDPRTKKERLRKLFDKQNESMIHMTDNTHQALEYIQVLYPNMVEEFIKRIREYDQTSSTKKLGYAVKNLIKLKVNLRHYRGALSGFFKQLV